MTKRIRIDSDGNLRCWNCGSKSFLNKRSFAAKISFGIFSLFAKKKMKCQSCGKYNQPGKNRLFGGRAKEHKK